MYTLTNDSDYAGFDQVNLGGGSSGESSLSRLQDSGFVSLAITTEKFLVRIIDSNGQQTGAEVIVAANGYNPEIVGWLRVAISAFERTAPAICVAGTVKRGPI